MRGFLDVPAGDVVLRRGRVMGGAEVDVRIVGGRVAAVGAGLPPGGAEVELSGGMVLPGFVDLHTHLDKGHIWPRAGNPDGTHGAAVAAVMADRARHWTAGDVAARAGFALRCAYAHGTVAVRTHLDSAGGQLDVTWPVFEALRAEWAGRVALQGVALVGLDAYATPFVERMADRVAEAGGLLGGSGALQADAAALIGRVFDLAVDRGLDVDLHADETLDPAAHTLRLIAHETVRRGWEGRVTCGHCCSLAAQDPAEAAETIAAVRDAGVIVVSLPMVNLYLQGRRPGRTPVSRGMTLVHELRAAGVAVALASDNTRDPFHAYGDLDMLEVLREAVRIGHLDQPVDGWAAAVTGVPAGVMGVGAGRVEVGAVADLVLFDARGWGELLSRPHSDRVVLRAGVAIDALVPRYRELDGLMAGGAA